VRTALLLTLLLALPGIAGARPLSFIAGGALGVSGPDQTPSSAITGSIEGAFVMDDTFVLDARARGFTGGGSEVVDAVFTGTVGVRYRVDVTEWVPYLRAGAGVSGSVGSPSGSAAVIELGLGLRWVFTEGWSATIEAGKLSIMDGLKPFGDAAFIALGAARHWNL
jgi:hypothetical protein